MKRLLKMMMGVFALSVLSFTAAASTYNLGTLSTSSTKTGILSSFDDRTHIYRFSFSRSGSCVFYVSEDTANAGWSSDWILPSIYKISGSSRICLTAGDLKFSQCQIASSRSVTLSCDAGVTYEFQISVGSSQLYYPYTIKITPPNAPSPTSKPDLQPYTPSGWSAPLVITTSSSSTTSLSSFKDTDTIYVRRAVSCSGKSVGAFKTALYVDGTLKKTFETDSLAVDKYVYHTSGVSIGTLSAGSHTIKIVVDSGSAISESNESNNTYTKTITVTATQKYYTVKFHKNDDSGVTKSYTDYPIGKSKNLPWVNSGLGWYYDSEGLQFEGWSRSSTSTVASYANGQSVYNLTTTAGGTVNLYAVLSANVYFAAGGGTGSKSSLKFARGARYTLPSCPFTRSGYTFAGWNVTSCCSYFDNPVAAGTQITINENTTLTATWKAAPPKTYTVRFHLNEPDKGNINPTKPVDTYYDQSFTVGKSQNLAWKDSKIGWADIKYHRFMGWARTSTATVAQYSNGQSVLNLGTANERVDLYAVWALMPSTYLVRFYRNNMSFSTKVGGVEGVYEQSFKVGTYQTLAWKDSQMKWDNPSGKTFLGWAKSRTATTATYKNGESVRNIGADGEVVCLYAVWGDQVQTYTVRFNKNDGSGVTETRTYSAGATLSLPWINSGLNWATPSGWSIVGWAKSASATSAAYANGAKVPALGTAGQTINLYVVWKKPTRTYTVRFNKNDGSGATATQTFVVGNAQCLRWKDSDLKWTYSGHSFVCWMSLGGGSYQNGQSVKDLAAAGATIDLYAVWISSSKSNAIRSAASINSASRTLQTGGGAVFSPGNYRGEFADGTGTFDLLLDEDGTAFFRAETEDGVWMEDGVLELTADLFTVTFADGSALVGTIVGDRVASARLVR